TETLSPKFCFMNSVILDFSSSGEGNGGVGGGGVCAMETNIELKRLRGNASSRSVPHPWGLFRGFQLCRKSPVKGKHDDSRRSSAISSARRTASSSARTSS